MTLKRGCGHTGRTVHSMRPLVLTVLPRMEVTGGGGPPSVGGSGCAPASHRLSGCWQLALPALLCSSARAHAVRLDWEGCFLENPVRRESSREGAHFQEHSRRCPAVPDSVLFVGGWENGWTVGTVLLQSSCPRVPTCLVWQVHGLCLYAFLAGPRWKEQTFRKSEATKSRKSSSECCRLSSPLVSFCVWWPSVFALGSHVDDSAHYYFKEVKIYWTLSPCTMLWTNCRYSLQDNLFLMLLLWNIIISVHRWKSSQLREA